MTHQITHPAKGFTMSVQITQLELSGKDAGAGFRIGVRGEFNEYRSICFVGGISAGVADGRLVLGPKSAPLAASVAPKSEKFSRERKAES